MITEQEKEALMIRYGYFLAKRYTAKQKDRFLFAIKKDLQGKGKFTLDSFQNQGKKNKNAYLGNVKKAKRIIATYYDTPAMAFGKYYPLDKKAQAKKSLLTTLFFAMIFLLFGVLLTLIFTRRVLAGKNLFSLPSLLIMCFYFAYFLLFHRLLRGLPSRKTLVRNSSSLLFLLIFLLEGKGNSNTAFAFLDAGTKNNGGLERLRSINPTAEIVYLDSIGADAPLLSLDAKKHKALFAEARLPEGLLLYLAVQKEEGEFWLSREQLKTKKLNLVNLESLYQSLGEEYV